MLASCFTFEEALNYAIYKQDRMGPHDITQFVSRVEQLWEAVADAGLKYDESNGYYRLIERD